jgi:two-component system NtrC family sensor kinase
MRLGELQRTGSARRPLRALLVASLLVPALLFALTAFLSYRAHFDDVRERLAREADVLREHASKVFETAQLVIGEINTVLAGRSAAAIKADESSVHAILAGLIRSLPQFRDVWIIDRDGRPLASALFDPVPAALDLTDRDYFGATRATPGLFIGDVVTGRASGMRYFNIADRRRDAAGQFDGVVALAVVPEYFTAVYERLFGPTVALAGLVRADGTILGRFPSLGEKEIRLSPQSGFARSVARAPAGGFYQAVAETDGVTRLFAYRRLDQFPVYVYAARDRDVVVADWVWSMSSHLVFGVPATLCVFLITLVALRRTERAEAEARRREAAEEALRQSQKMEALGQLTGGVAHDFNNLLLVLNGNLDLLKQHARPEHGRLIAAMERALLRAEALTRQLLAFARRKPLRAERIDVVREMPKILETLRRSLRSNIALEARIPPETWPVEADPSELELALLNLSVNARDAMPRGGSLTITAENVPAADAAALAEPLPGDFVRLAARDTGTGIAPELLGRVFDPFFTTKSVERGTGLGLSQVHGFAKQSGGTATIRSRPGEGTTVEIYLPRSLAAATRESEPGIGPARAPKGEGARILIVDDNIEVGETTRGLVEKLGYRVRFVISGADALAAFAEEPADLVLSDIVMPQMTGIELARTLRQRHPALPILLATGYSEAVKEARAAGFPLITKPYRIEQLGQAIRDRLDLAEASAPR